MFSRQQGILRICVLSLLLIFLFFGTAAGKKGKKKKPVPLKPIPVSELKSRMGTKVTFVQMDKQLARFGYQSIHDRPGQIGGLPYAAYVGQNGTIKDVWKASDGIRYYWIIVLDSGKKVYAEISRSNPDYIAGMYSAKDMIKGDGLVGKDIWVNQAEYKLEPQSLITENPKISYTLSHLEKVRVLGVLPKIFGHGPARARFYLKVRNQGKNEGLLGYNKINFFLTDPIDRAWGKENVDAIKQKDVRIGMTMEQAIAAVGRPLKIKSVEQENEIRATWDYGGLKLIFKNGKLWKIKRKSGR